MLGVFGPKNGKIGLYEGAFIYQGPFKEDFCAGSPAINEVVLEGRFSEVGVGHPRGGSCPLLDKRCSHPRLIYYIMDERIALWGGEELTSGGAGGMSWELLWERSSDSSSDFSSDS